MHTPADHITWPPTHASIAIHQTCITITCIPCTVYSSIPIEVDKFFRVHTWRRPHTQSRAWSLVKPSKDSTMIHWLTTSLLYYSIHTSTKHWRHSKALGSFHVKALYLEVMGLHCIYWVLLWGKCTCSQAFTTFSDRMQYANRTQMAWKI